MDESSGRQSVATFMFDKSKESNPKCFKMSHDVLGFCIAVDSDGEVDIACEPWLGAG